MDQSRRRSLSEKSSSPDPEGQTTSDQTSEPSENTTDVNKKFESSLSVSERPESKSTQSKAIEPHNVSQAPSLQETGTKLPSKQTSLKTVPDSPSNQSSSKDNFSKCTETAVNTKPCAFSASVVSKQDIGSQQPAQHLTGHQRYTSSYSQASAIHAPSAVPAHDPPGHYTNMNPAIMHRSSTPTQNQTLHSGNPEQRFIVPSNEERTQFSLPIRSATNLHQYQFPPPYIMMGTQPVYLLPRTMPALNYNNQLPSAFTNATPVIYVQPSTPNESTMAPVRMAAVPVQHAQFIRPAAPNIAGEMSCPLEIQKRFDLSPEIPNQTFTLPALQQESPASEDVDEQNATVSNLDQSRKPTKLEKLAKSLSYRKKNMLYVDIPKAPSPKTLFPSYATPEGGKVLKVLTPTPIQIETSPDTIDSESALDGAGTIINQEPENVAIQFRPLPNIPIQPVIQAPIMAPIQPVFQAPIMAPIQPVIQAPIMAPIGTQYLPVMPNPVAIPQYYYQNMLIYNSLQYHPPMHNLTSMIQHQNVNLPINQDGAQNSFLQTDRSLSYAASELPTHPSFSNTIPMQPTAENISTNVARNLSLPAGPENVSMRFRMYSNLPLVPAVPVLPAPILVPDRTLYPQTMPNPVAIPPYYYPNMSIYNPAFLQTGGSLAHAVSASRISTQQGSSNTIPMQPIASNPSCDVRAINPNLVQNISGGQRSVENPFPNSINQNPPQM